MICTFDYVHWTVKWFHYVKKQAATSLSGLMQINVYFSIHDVWFKRRTEMLLHL